MSVEVKAASYAERMKKKKKNLSFAINKVKTEDMVNNIWFDTEGVGKILFDVTPTIMGNHDGGGKGNENEPDRQIIGEKVRRTIELAMGGHRYIPDPDLMVELRVTWGPSDDKSIVEEWAGHGLWRGTLTKKRRNYEVAGWTYTNQTTYPTKEFFINGSNIGFGIISSEAA